MNIIEKYASLLFLLMWSSGAIFVKLGLEDASVSVFLTVRAAGATVLMFIVCVLVVDRDGLKRTLLLPIRYLVRAVMIGILLQAGYQAAYFLALSHRLTPGVLAIILGLQPILTPLFANERTGKFGYFYLLLGLTGLAIAMWGARNLGAVTLTGLCFGLVAVIAISAGSVMQKNSVIDPVVSAFYQTLTATCIFLLMLPATEIKLDLTPTFIASATWMIVVVSTLSVLLLFRMLVHKSASKVGVLFYMVPVITILLDYLTFGNEVSWVTLVGALLVVIAIKGFSKVQLIAGSPRQNVEKNKKPISKNDQL